MTVFAKQTMNVTDWAKVQDQIEALTFAMPKRTDLMMLSADTDSVLLQDIIIGLPSDDLLAAFPGFTRISREEIPDYLSALVLREDGMDAFPDIQRKRRRKPE